MPSGLGAREAKRLLGSFKQQGEGRHMSDFASLYLSGGGSKDDTQSVTQRLSGMGIQEVGMEVGEEMNFNEERSSMGSKMSQVADRKSMGGKSRSMVGMEEGKSKSSSKEEEEANVDNTGLGAEATRGVVEGANMGNKH